MPSKFGAGKLVELMAFDERQPLDDGYGNTVAGPWVERFQCRAAFIHLKGGNETVMQARLESHPSIIVRVRKSSASSVVRENWQARDVRRGTIYNVRSIVNDNSRAVLDILCEANVGN
jgi:hypothetical protein